jgi:enoyl-CoA hydratase
MSASHLQVERRDHVVIVTMDRPEARNAWSLQMLVQMWEAWEMIDADPEVRCAILTGAGGTFCAGADLKLMHSDQADDPWHARFREDPDLHWRALLRHYRLKKPLIAAVEGFALGGGTEILQATDIRVAGESAKFGVTEAVYGLFPLGGSTVRLRRQIPHTMAMEMLLTGRRVSAAEALSFGLIGRVVEDGKALETALEIAQQVAANGPLAVQAIKRSVAASEWLPESEALAKELEIGQPVFATEDAREGPRAFAARRKPDFKGR